MHYLIFFFLSIFLNSRVSSLPQSKVSIDPVLYPNNTINYDISTTTNYSYNLEYLDNGNWIEDHKTLFKPFIINYNNLVDYKNDTLRYRFLFLNENEIIYSNTFKLAHIDMRYSINKINNGELNQEELMSEAFSLMNKMNGKSGTDNFMQNMMQNMMQGNNMDNLNNLFNDQQNTQATAKPSTTKERLKKKIENKRLTNKKS